MVRLFSPRGGQSLGHVLLADVEHIRYELITFLIASRDTVSAQFWVVVRSHFDDRGTVLVDRRPRF